MAGIILRTKSTIVRVLHVHHAPPLRQARPPRSPSGCRCRCIARKRPRSCTHFVCTSHDGHRCRHLRTESSTMVTFNETGRIEMPRVFIHRKAYLLAYLAQPCLLWTTVKVCWRMTSTRMLRRVDHCFLMKMNTLRSGWPLLRSRNDQWNSQQCAHMSS